MSKIKQKKHVFEILEILFPGGQYVPGKEDVGRLFLESLKKPNPDRGRRAYALLYSEPLESCTYKRNGTYTIEGIPYYVCSKWGWGDRIAYPVNRVISGLCQEAYVTEKMKLALRAVEKQWGLEKAGAGENVPSEKEETNEVEESESSEPMSSHATEQPVNDSVSPGFWILVNKPNYAYENEFDLKETSVPQAFRIRKSPDSQRRKELLRARKGDYVISYESSPKTSVTALAKVYEPSSEELENDVLFVGIERINSNACVRWGELNENEVIRESRFVKRNAQVQGSIFALTYNEYKEIIRMIRTKQMEDMKRNYIVFGAPGTGKSFYLSEYIEKKSLFGDRYERVTFHPEYSYFDFVGSYKPVMEEKDGAEQIVYRFEAGPFARVLKKALSKDSIINDIPHLLMIEEINRARVAAVFGDMFQLLDRNEKGESMYPISPTRDLLTYLTTNNEDGEAVELRNGKIYIPSNMYIWATMNSADQGVYPMDTAFKRRWSFKYVDIDNREDVLESGSALHKEWNEIRKEINGLLQKTGINEDKQMGAFFVSLNELQDDASFVSAFKSKVIMYLYEDAARHKRMAVFREPQKRYSELCRDFEKACVDGVSAASIIQSLFRA